MLGFDFPFGGVLWAVLAGLLLAGMGFILGAVFCAPRLATLERQLRVWVIGLSFSLFVIEILLVSSAILRR
jgi:hypothetical protein